MTAARVLVADPAWLFGDKLPGKTRGAVRQYPCIGVDEIAKFPLPVLAADCVLFLWRVAAMQDDALYVVQEWGFKLKTELVWNKTRICMRCSGKGYTTPRYNERDGLISRKWCERCEGRGFRLHFGMGRYVRGAHETCLIATRGRCFPKVRNVRSTFSAPVGRHSEKPEEFYRIVEQLYDGPYVELFARRPREGWLTYGNELAEAHP